jgi:F-type H+-transporting ATPase subunit delta
MALVSSAPRVFDTEATNLVMLLIESDRVRDVGGIEEEFNRLADEAAGRVRATVTTAVQLSAEDRERVADGLSRRLGKDVDLEVLVDPHILGGLKLQYGDRLVDASVATRLQQLRRRLAAS